MSGSQQQVASMENFSLHELFGFFARNLRFMVLGAVIGALLGLAVTFWQKPLFRSESTFQFNESKQSQMSLDSMFSFDKSSSADTAIPILKSRALAEEVVKKLALNAELTNVSDATFGKVLRRKLRQWLNPPASTEGQGISGKIRYHLASLLGDPGAFGYLTISDLRFDSFLQARQLTLVLHDDGKGLDLFDESGAKVAQCVRGEVCRVTFGKGEISFTPHRIIPGYDSRIEMRLRSLENAAARVRSSIIVTPLGRSMDNFLLVSCKWPDPYQAAKIVEVLGWAYSRRDRTVSTRSYDQMISFLEQSVGPAEAKLDEADRKLRKFLREQNVVDMPEKYRQGLQTISGFEQMRLEGELRRKELTYLASSLKSADPTTYGSLVSPISDDLAGEWSKLQEKSIELAIEKESLNGFTENYPPMKRHMLAVKTLQQRQQDLKRKALEVIREQQRLLRKKDETIQASIDEVEQGMGLDSGTQNEYLRLQRGRDIAEKLYGMLLEKREEMRITKAGSTASMQVLDTPLPGGQVSPRPWMNLLIGGLFGFLSVGLFAFLRESLDLGIRNPSELERAGLYVHGLIPEHREAEESEGLVTIMRPTSVEAEAYRSLRTSIQLSSLENHVRSIMITSSGPGEGKSTTMANLAVTLAQAGKRTLVVDCDMRRPVVNRLLDVEPEPGLSEILGGGLDWRQYVSETGVAGLFALSSGAIPANPSELIGRTHMADILAEMKQEYDFVLCDVPPILVVSDAALLASHLDGVLVLVRSGIPTGHDIARAKEQMERVGGKVLGAVFNAYSGDGAGYGHYSYGHYSYGGYYQQQTEDEAPVGRLQKQLDAFLNWLQKRS